MIVEISQSMDEYIDKGSEVTLALRVENGPILQALHKYHEYFATVLWRDVDLDPIPAFLSMNAFMLYLAGIRVALTGHVSAVFPVLRTALESASYSFLMTEDPELVDIWTNRHKSKEGLKLCRRRFSSAVPATAAAINREQPGGGDWILEAYDAAIDFGAHPNIRSVFGHVSFDDDQGDDFHRISLTGLYGRDSWETKRVLIGCLDFGLAIAVLLTRALNAPDQEHQDRLQALSDLKNRIVEDFARGNGAGEHAAS